MRVSFFKVKKLFGSFDYEFNIDSDESVFLLTGPNGYGKTTILNILSELSKRNFYYFYILPFQEIHIGFDSNTKILITSEAVAAETETSDVENKPDRQITFAWEQHDKCVSSFKIDRKILEGYARKIRHRGLFGAGWEHWQISGDVRSKEYEMFMTKTVGIQSSIAEDQEAGQFVMLLRSISVRMLPSDRLTFDNRREKEERASSISRVSENLKNLLHEYYIEYLKNVNKSNNDLFDKLLSMIEPLTEEEYEVKKKDLSPKLFQLFEWGLCDENTIRPYNEGHKEILSVYIREMQQNLQVYEEVYAKLLLFKEMLDAKQFVNKKILFHPLKGIVAQCDTGFSLELDKLSSGEQHEIIMLYYAIFGISRNSILLIDEPENSLHVVWQNHYLADIEKIANKLNIQILIATHSPQIISGRWDDCYDLFEAMNHA